MPKPFVVHFSNDDVFWVAQDGIATVAEWVHDEDRQNPPF